MINNIYLTSISGISINTSQYDTIIIENGDTFNLQYNKQTTLSVNILNISGNECNITVGTDNGIYTIEDNSFYTVYFTAQAVLFIKMETNLFLK